MILRRRRSNPEHLTDRLAGDIRSGRFERELLPGAENRVTLADATNSYGLSVARMDHSLTDKANMDYSTKPKAITNILHAADAQDVLTIQRFAHLIGGARMGADSESLVVDSDERIWGVRNVFVADGSVCPTEGSANPALTIMALALRLAQRLTDGSIIQERRGAAVGVAGGR